MSGMVYFALAQNGLIKIGRTNNFVRRMRGLRTMSASPHIFSVAVESYDSKEYERKLHYHFSNFKSHGEWFSFSGSVSKQLYWLLLDCGEKEQYLSKALERRIQDDDDVYYFNYNHIWIMLLKEHAIEALSTFSRGRLVNFVNTKEVDGILNKAMDITAEYKGKRQRNNNDYSILDIFKYSLNELEGSLSQRALYDPFKEFFSQLELKAMLKDYDNQIITLGGEEYKIVPSKGGAHPRRIVPLSDIEKTQQYTLGIANTR